MGWGGGRTFARTKNIQKEKKQVHLKETAQHHKAGPNIYSDMSQVSSEEVLRQNKTSVWVNVLGARFGKLVGSFPMTPTCPCENSLEHGAERSFVLLSKRRIPALRRMFKPITLAKCDVWPRPLFEIVISEKNKVMCSSEEEAGRSTGDLSACRWDVGGGRGRTGRGESVGLSVDRAPLPPGRGGAREPLLCVL